MKIYNEGARSDRYMGSLRFGFNEGTQVISQTHIPYLRLKRKLARLRHKQSGQRGQR